MYILKQCYRSLLAPIEISDNEYAELGAKMKILYEPVTDPLNGPKYEDSREDVDFNFSDFSSDDPVPDPPSPIDFSDMGDDAFDFGGGDGGGGGATGDY